ncbi:uncharacterized protein LOC121886146 [Thunnus maccoyii]|uniref:uncharacterized protein LOC121886146 n=1 Tax=Thunnus maccoyii TaxID=8240 RepID=UPI001C4C644B|nr:uncharacterized protein LOC121886146 [Thunnus maccoyii]
MRSWLLLVSLLVSDLCPLGDGDWVMDYFSWSLCRKLFLNGQRTPKGLGILETHTEHPSMCIHRSCVYVAVQHKQKTSPFCWEYTVHEDHGHRSDIPLLVVLSFHRNGKSVAAFLVKPAVTIAAMHVINGATLTKAGAEASHITTDIIKDLPDSRPSRLVHHHTTASGHKFHAFLLGKSQSWAPATIVQLQKMLTKSCSVATTVIIPRCLKEGQTKAAMTIREISEKLFAKPQMRLQESKKRAMDIKVHMDYRRRHPATALVKQHDILPAATLHSGSSSVKASDTSQLERHGNRANIKKKNEHLTSDEESMLQKNVQKQLSLKAASTSVNDDGFYLTRQLLLVPRDKKESINGLRYKIRAAQDHNKERFNEKIITKQAELKQPEGQSETGRSHTNTIEYILRADSTHKTQNNDAGHKQLFTEVGEEVLIMSLLPDTETETQTKPSCEIKLILNADTGWKTINTPINELHTIKVIKEGFMIQPGNSKHAFPLKIFTTDPKEIHTSPASEITTTTTATTASAYTKENIKETTRTIEHPQTDGVTHENVGINYTEQEENMPSEDSVLPSPPAHKMIEDTKAETTAVNTEIKQTTPIMEVFKINGTQKADRLLPNTEETQTTTMNPEPETVYEPRFIKYKPGNIQATTAKSFSGLRMREDILEDLTRLHEGIKDEEGAYVSPATTNRPGTKRKEDQDDPRDNRRETIPNQVTDNLQKVSEVSDFYENLCQNKIDTVLYVVTGKKKYTEFQRKL